MEIVLAFGIGNPGEWVIVFIVALIVFGPDKLPEVGRQVGRALRDFRKIADEVTGATQSIRDEITEAAGTTRHEVESLHPVSVGGVSSPVAGAGDEDSDPRDQALMETDSRVGEQVSDVPPVDASPQKGLRLSTLGVAQQSAANQTNAGPEPKG